LVGQCHSLGRPQKRPFPIQNPSIDLAQIRGILLEFKYEFKLKCPICSLHPPRQPSSAFV
jgi:hypothetical protein